MPQQAKFSTETVIITATTIEEMTLDAQVAVSTNAVSTIVQDSNGNPIENARVNLRRENGSYVNNRRTDSSGIASFEAMPNADLKFEVDYNGGKYSTDAQTITEAMTEEVQTQPLTVSLMAEGIPLANQRVDLLRANDSYVTNTRTDASGIVVFEVVPGAVHKVRVKYDGESWVWEEVYGNELIKVEF